MAYTPEQIKQAIIGAGYGDAQGNITNARGVYDAAKQYGVGANELDAAWGAAPGTSAGWIQQQGWGALPGQQQAAQGGGGQTPQPPNPYAPTPVGDFQSAGIQQSAPNPYIGKTTQGAAAPGSNPYAGSNSYMQGMIDSSVQDVTRNFNNSVVPQLDRMGQQSGSFGNSGVAALQGEAYRNLNQSVGDLSNRYRFQDYQTQQQLAEAGLNRAQQGNQFNASLRQGDLNRNAQLFQGQSQFDANAANQGSMFNAGQANNYGLQTANLRQNQNQFNDQMDYNIYQGNVNNARNAQNDTINNLSTLYGLNKDGTGAATTEQNTPLNYYLQFLGASTQAGGLGGSNSQTNQGSPWLGALGGWQAFKP